MELELYAQRLQKLIHLHLSTDCEDFSSINETIFILTVIFLCLFLHIGPKNVNLPSVKLAEVG